jgi:hypothetical protein
VGGNARSDHDGGQPTGLWESLPYGGRASPTRPSAHRPEESTLVRVTRFGRGCERFPLGSPPKAAMSYQMLDFLRGLQPLTGGVPCLTQ